MSEQPSLEQIQQQCIFCQIISGQIPAQKVFEDDKFVAVLDINPASPGHMLVISKEHYAIMPQIPEEEIKHLGKITKALSQVLLKTLQCQGTTVFVANGPAAGQRAQHFMMHIIPRNEGDDVGIQLPERELSSELVTKLKQALAPGLKKNLGFEIKVEPVNPSTDVDLDGVSAVLGKKDDDEKEDDEKDTDEEDNDERDDNEEEVKPKKTVKKIRKKKQVKKSDDVEVSIDDITKLL